MRRCRPALQWAGDSAVAAYAPEVNRHQETGHQRQSDAMQDVEAEQRALSYESSAEQGEAGIARIVHQRNVAEFEQRRSRPFISRERSCASHIAADRDRPD